MYTIRMDLLPLVLIFVLILIGIPVIFALLLARMTRGAAREAARQRAILDAALAKAVFSAATVVSARRLGQRLGGTNDVMRVTLSVEPPENAAYTAVVTWEVEPQTTHLLQPGAALAVKINPDNPRQVFPNFSGAQFLPE